MEDETKDKPNAMTHPQDEAALAESSEPNDAAKSQPAIEETCKLREITTKEAYFASLNEWVKHANISQNAMALFPWYLMSSYPQIFQQQTGLSSAASSISQSDQSQMPNAAANINAQAAAAAAATRNGFTNFRLLDDQTQMALINRTGGYEYHLAPFWKRAIAEMIDMILLFLLKIVLTFTLMNIFDLDIGFDFDKDTLRKAMDEDDYTGFLEVSMSLFSFSSDLLLLEILTKVMVCFYEAIWTAMFNGATPGKAIMNIRIVYVEAVLLLQVPQEPLAGAIRGAQHLETVFQTERAYMRALLYPAETPNFKRALVRSAAKNFIVTILFPICFVMIFFKNKRTAYDIISKTVVVENNPNPVFRRP